MVLYLFSYEIFIAGYNIIDNLCNLIFRQKVYFNFMNYHYGGCSDRETLIYIFSALSIKLILFFAFAYYLNNGKIKIESVISELVISFFLFDFISFFAQCVDKFNLIKFQFNNYFVANSEIIFNYYLQNSALIISAVWSVLLLLLLKRHNRLNMKYIFKRIILSSLSIIILLLMISFYRILIGR